MSGPGASVKPAVAGAAARHGILLGLAFAAAALLVYAPSLPGPLVSDDVLYLEHNGALALPFGAALRSSFGELFFANWTPLHQLWLYAGVRAFGVDPTPFRVANVLLHTGVALLLVATIRRAGVRPGVAAVAGALFLLHPVAVEAVAWINQSKTLLATGFSLLALERWLAHLREPRGGRLAAATAAGTAALLSKPAALPLVAILLVAIWTQRAAPAWRRALGLLPLAVVTAIALPLNLQAQALQGGVAPWFGGSPEATARILPWLGLRYLRLVVAPVDLDHGVHPAPTSGWGDPRFWLPCLAIAGIAAGVVWLCRQRRERWLGPAWFSLMLVPVLQLVPMANVFGDRYLYTALPGATLLGAQLADAALARGRRLARPLWAASIAFGLALAAGTIAQARLWADPELLYRASTEAYPWGRIGWTGLGAVRHARQDLAGAADAYLHSLAVHPKDGHVRHLLGRVRILQGDRGRALYDLEESVRLFPNHHDVVATRRMVARLRRDGVRPVADEPPPGMAPLGAAESAVRPGPGG